MVANVLQVEWARRRPAWRPLLFLAGISIAYYLAAEIAFLIGTLSDDIFAPFWPPNTVLFCALLLNPRSRWWAIVAAVFPAHLVAELRVGMPFAPLMVAFATNCAIALLNAWTVARLVGGPPWLGTIRKAAAYVATTGAVNPAIVALAGAFVPIMGDGVIGDYWVYWSNWFVGNALAALTIGPIVLTTSERRTMFWSLPLRRQGEAALFVAALLGACLLTFEVSVQMAGSPLVPAVLYLPLPIVLWGSLRFGERGASGAILLVTVASIWLTLNGPSPFLGESPETSVLALQLFLIGLAVPVLLLSAAIAQLRDAEQATRALSRSLLLAQDEERRRIARELHDSTGQNLIAARLLLGSFKEELSEGALIRLKRWEDVVQHSIHELRTMSYLLHPPSLEQGGLATALPCYVKGFAERSGIRVDLAMPPDLEGLPQEIELVVYRVVQEALGNVHRHSGSEVARITLERTTSRYGSRLLLTVEDEGCGFDPGRQSGPGRRGLGLESMRERIHQAGGHLVVESVPGRTRVVATIPLGRAAEGTG